MTRNTTLCICLAYCALLAGCGGGTTKETTVISADTTAPLVLVTSPSPGATGIATNTTLTATFSEAVDPATITAGTFTVAGVSGAVAVSGDHRIVTFTPGVPLTASTVYTATLTTGIHDAAGNALFGNVTWSFTTAAAPDTTAPSVQSVAPTRGSAANPASAPITVTFSELLNCTTVSTLNVHLLEALDDVPIEVDCEGDTISLLPIFGTPTNTQLTASIGPGVTDRAGNPLGTPYHWSFGVAPWTRQFGTAARDVAYGLTLDADGNLYVAGVTEGALDDQSSAGGDDLFIAKYDTSGAKQWTRQLGTASVDFARAVTRDAGGNVFVAGGTSGALDGQSSAGGSDLFITKHDANGTRHWTRQLGTAVSDNAVALTSDAAGNVYAAGSTAGALDGQSSAGDWDPFVTKYDGNGAKQWTRQLGTATADGANAIASDANGNVYLAGYTHGAMNDQSSAGGRDFFIAKYDGNGDRQWTRQLGTAAIDHALTVTSDAAGNVYVAGYTYGVLDGPSNAGGADLFLAKYDSNGARLWTRQFGTAADDNAYALTSDASGNVYVSGTTGGALDGGNAGGNDLFITKYDGNGARQWTRQLGTVSSDYVNALAADAFGNVYAAGYTSGALDGQPSIGNSDAFIVKYQADGRKR